MKIEFEVYGRPQGKARPRMTRSGHVYTPKETKQYEALVKASFEKVKPEGWKPISTAVIVTIEAFFIKAKSNKDKYCTIKPDIDNIQKIILDGIQGNDNVILDDKSVIGIVTRKFWGVIDKVRVTVETVETVEVMEGAAHEQ